MIIGWWATWTTWSNQGKRFDGELHIVHYNTKYRRVSIIVEFRYHRYYCRRLAKVCKAEQNESYSFSAGICRRQTRWACCVGRFSAGKIDLFNSFLLLFTQFSFPPIRWGEKLTWSWTRFSRHWSGFRFKRTFKTFMLSVTRPKSPNRIHEEYTSSVITHPNGIILV